MAPRDWMYIADHERHSTHDTYEIIWYEKTIQTTVTKTPSAVSNWISTIKSVHKDHLHRLIIGLDCEWRPSFIRGQVNPIALLQLCVGNRCLIYQILHSQEIPQDLIDFLADGNYTFVGVSVKSDLDKLEKHYRIGGDVRWIDLGKLIACDYGDDNLMKMGLKAMARFAMGAELEKPKAVTMSRWDNARLSDNQVLYATLDAVVSFEIGLKFDADAY